MKCKSVVSFRDEGELDSGKLVGKLELQSIGAVGFITLNSRTQTTQ